MINPSTSYTIPFATTAAGVPTAADSTPTAVVWRNGSAEATSVTVSTTSNTGIYHAAFTTGSGWAKTDRIWLVVSATISSVAYRGIVWDSFSEPDAVMRGTDGANTTTPPTAGAIASTIGAYDQRANDGTAGTIGWYFKKLRQANLAVEATVTADVVATTKTFSVNLTTYPTGAFRHAVMTVVEDSAILEQNSPIETFTNNTTYSTIVLEEALTEAPQPGDVIVISANSHVHSIAAIVAGVWSAATSGLSVVGSTGRALARLIGLVQDVGGDEFTAKALNKAPTGGGGGTVNVLPAVGISAERNAGVVLNPFVGETISQAITLYQTDGVTPIDLSGKTLELVFDTRSGADVAVVANADITVSGVDNNIITFAYPAAVTASERVLRVALRDASAPRTVYLSGLCKVSLAPFND